MAEDKQQKNTGGKPGRLVKRRLFAAALFFSVLFGMTAAAWYLPARPTVSQREKRELAQIPEFSLSSLADGSYFRGIELWFSDTFPGRDGWVKTNLFLKNLYGRSDVVIYGEIRQSDQVPVPTPEPAVESVPAAAPPEAGEPAPATPAPTETPEPSFEPEDPVWMGVDVEEADLIRTGAVIQVDNRAFEYTGFSQYYSGVFADMVNRAAGILKEQGRGNVYSVVLPTSTTVMLPRDFRERVSCIPEEDVFEYMYGLMNEDVITVDVLSALLQHNNEYVYFYGDHHWTALGAWYGYAQWARSAGKEPVGLDAYTERVFEPFYGSLYYQANQSARITVDTVYAYEPKGNVRLYLSFDTNDTKEHPGYEYPLLTDVRGTDKYLCFLGGDVPLATFVNDDIQDGSACLLLKDSNGNVFSYYLTAHYQYVYVVDYRKYRHRTLREFAEMYDVDDMIFCFSALQSQGRGNQLANLFVGN